MARPSGPGAGGSGRPGRERLDAILVDRGLFPSRARAHAAILAGQVRVEGLPDPKPGSRIAANTPIDVRGDPVPYASRAGLKLEKALDAFRLDPAGLACLDLGASTGGFTDLLLRRGARRVFAVDVGYGQLAWHLRQDPRVVVLERTNARLLTRNEVPEAVGFLTADLSFIGLDKVLPAVRPLCAEGAQGIVLVKPQFEAGPGQVGKRGVVRDPSVHRVVLERMVDRMPGWGFQPVGLTWSPIRGAEGNIEFLLAITAAPAADGGGSSLSAEDVARVVAEAGAHLA